MKQLAILFVFLCATIGCNEDQVNPNTLPVNFGQEFPLKVGDKAVATANTATDSLLVEVISIQDNRCPRDVECIRAGEVQVEVIVTSRQQSENLAMCIGPDCGYLEERFRNSTSNTVIDTAYFTLDNIPYQLILENVLPYPMSDGQGANTPILRIVE